MLYTFKSPATANLLMLEKSGAQLLTIIGKELTPQGIITVAQIPDAIAALEAEVARQEAAQGQPEDGPTPESEEVVDHVSLSQRVMPFVEMLQRSEDAGEGVVWGV
jgi:hypothetical protein